MADDDIMPSASAIPAADSRGGDVTESFHMLDE